MFILLVSKAWFYRHCNFCSNINPWTVVSGAVWEGGEGSNVLRRCVRLHPDGCFRGSGHSSAVRHRSCAEQMALQWLQRIGKCHCIPSYLEAQLSLAHTAF